MSKSRRQGLSLRAAVHRLCGRRPTAVGTVEAPRKLARGSAGAPCPGLGKACWIRLSGRVCQMMNRLLSPGKLLAKTIAAVAIAVFWCVSTVGTTVGTTVGVTTLASAVTAATSTPAEARRRRWRGGRHWRGARRWRGRGWYGYPYYRRSWYGYPYYRRGWYGPRFGIWFGF
jgi:hypothetical protein